VNGIFEEKPWEAIKQAAMGEPRKILGPEVLKGAAEVFHLFNTHNATPPRQRPE
jgi:hypothetical protein